MIIREKVISLSYEILHPEEGNRKTGKYIREGFSVPLSALMSKFEDDDPLIIKLREERRNLGTSNPYKLSDMMRNKDKIIFKKMTKELIKIIGG